MFVSCFNFKNQTFIQEFFSKKQVEKMESVSILFTLKICYIFFTMFLRNKCIKDPCMCLLKNLIVYVSETRFGNITRVSWRNTNRENT
jgi:hypothetical protein